MRQFTDDKGKAWIAKPAEEATARHFGRWYLVFQPADDASVTYEVPEIRWQTAATGERTLKAMAEFELRRRLNSAVQRHAAA